MTDTIPSGWFGTPHPKPSEPMVGDEDFPEVEPLPKEPLPTEPSETEEYE